MKTINFLQIITRIFFLIVLTLGVLNLILIHPVPERIYLLVSLIFLPPLTGYIKERYRISIPPAIKIILGTVVVWFTLGISV